MDLGLIPIPPQQPKERLSQLASPSEGSAKQAAPQRCLLRRAPSGNPPPASYAAGGIRDQGLGLVPEGPGTGPYPRLRSQERLSSIPSEGSAKQAARSAPQRRGLGIWGTSPRLSWDQFFVPQNWWWFEGQKPKVSWPTKLVFVPKNGF